jgi:TPR repeat protein
MDQNTAVRYFQKGVLQKDNKAMFNLAMAYKNGQGVETDLPRCIELLGQAASSGSQAAKFHLGLLLEKGRSGLLDKDPPGAVKW